MSNTYVWSITDLLVIPFLNNKINVVVKVNYSVTGTDGNNNYVLNDFINIPYVETNTFIDFSSLTQEQVIEWVKEQLTIKGVTNIEARIDSELNSLKIIINPINSPVISYKLPWAK